MTHTERAVMQLYEVAQYMMRHADTLIGNMDDCYVVEGGLRFEFTLTDDASIPTITVTKEHLVYERQA